MSFVTGIWENFVQLAAAFGVLVAFLGSLAWVISKSTFVAGKISARQIKHRLETCPQKAVCDVAQCRQDDQIKQLKDISLLAQGGTIALHCSIAIQRGYLSLYDRTWLKNAYEAYAKAGGNHGVDELYREALLLQDHPTRSRRITDNA